MAQQLTSLLKSIALIGLAVVALVTTIDPVLAAPVTPLATPTGLALAGAIVIALQSAIYTYDGWTGPIYFGEELRDPPRDIPRAMIGGVVLVLAIYLSLNAAFLRVVPIREMAGDPFVAATAASRLFGSAGDVVIRVVMLLSLVATIKRASVDGLACAVRDEPRSVAAGGFSACKPRRNPRAGAHRRTVIALVCIATNTFNTLLAMLAFLFVANYALVFSALFVSRRRTPHASRPFRVPGYPFIPGLALAGSIAFIAGAVIGDRANSMLAVALLVISWPVYRAIRPRAMIVSRVT